MDQSDQEAENETKKNELDQTNGEVAETTIVSDQTHEEVAETIPELDQTNEVVAEATVELDHTINATGQTFDVLAQQRIEPNQPIVRLDEPGYQADRRGNELNEIGYGASLPKPGEIDNILDDMAFTETLPESVPKSVTPAKPDKPFHSILKNTAKTVIFVAVCWGAYRMKKKFYG